MVEAGSITFRLGLNTDDLRFGLDKAKYSMLEWRGETLKNSVEIAKWGAAIGATVAPVIAVGAAAYATIEKFGGMAQSIKDLSYTTGLSTQKIQELDYAATLSGTQFSVVTASVDNFTLAIAKAGDATSEAGKAFASLGVTTSGRTTDQILEDTFIALSDMKDETERNTIANTLYGRTWKEMIPYMDAYIKNIKEIKKNPYLTDEELDANAEAKEQIDALGKHWEIAEGRMISYFTSYFKNADKAYVESALKNPTGFYEKRILEDAGYSIDPNGTFDVGGGLQKPFKSTIDGVVKSASKLTNKYLNMSDAQIALQDATDALTEAQADQATALHDKNSEAYGKASRLVAIYTNKVKELTAALNESASAGKAAAGTGWSDQSVVGSHYDSAAFLAAGGTQEQWDASGAGQSEMYIFMMDEKAHGADYQTALNAWGYGTHSYSNAGDFATLGSGGAATTTRNPGKNEREATAATGSAAATGKTAVTPGSKEQTKSIQSEYDAQGKAVETLTGKITTEYQKQADAYKAYIESITISREKNYPILETMDLTHWATSEEIARVAEQKVGDFMATMVNFAGQNPIIQNLIVVDKNGPDWEPPAFVAVTAPKLTSADFSSVGASVQAIVAKGMGDGTSGTASAKKAAIAAGTQITINQEINGVDSTTTNKVTNATLSGINRAEAGVNGLGGAMI